MTQTDRDDIPPFRYNSSLAQDIERKWRDRWDESGAFVTPNPSVTADDPAASDALGQKLFVLDMFPYPSGTGLHVGHPLGYIATDTYVRFQRMLGRNVLYTMGFDAFGLPAEQYAIETGQHPAITTDGNVAIMRRQLHRLGLSHDPNRSVSTTDPSYYRWTQWIFSRIFNAWYDSQLDQARPIDELEAELAAGTRASPDGRPWSSLSPVEQAAVIDNHRLAYRAEAPVNWCPGLGTVVANEEVTADGRSDRGNFPVYQRTMRQWMMRITVYADRLLADLDLLDWPEPIKAMQRNWIGRSTGAVIRFETEAGPIPVFTTRHDTVFGATFLVLAPEHPMVDAVTNEGQAEAVAAYRRQADQTSDLDRQDESRRKSGVDTGAVAVNPATGEEIPIWIADYVLMGYGTGAIMSVPCGDQRDFEMARRFDLPIRAIQRPPDSWFDEHRLDPTLDCSRWPQAFVGDAEYVQSSNDSLTLDGLTTVEEAISRTDAWLEESGSGHPAVTYRLRDWLFSRQRYWGEPFPIVYDRDGIAHSIPDELLPVLLPETESFSPRTFDPEDEFSEPESPLDRIDSFMNVELDIGHGRQQYRRDGNVMPQWAGSCWYELRYLDPGNDDALVDPEIERYWMGPDPDVPGHPGGVDLYVGGVEHAVLHLLYARFWHKILFDLGHVSSKEPFYRLFNQGYILAAAYTDDRGVYVPADKVTETADGRYLHEGSPVEREWGKMGKSLKNGISPDDIYHQYGADTLRLYEMSMGPLDQSRPWDTRDIVGMYRFLQRLWRNVVDEDSGETIVVDEEPDPDTRRLLHRCIAAVNEDMQTLRFNTAVAKLIELNNHLTKLEATPRAVAEALTVMVAPLAPHVAEELWSRLGHENMLVREPFPVADPTLLVTDTIELPIQVNGKVRSRITVAADAEHAVITAAALADDRIQNVLGDSKPKKVIVVDQRLVSIVA